MKSQVAVALLGIFAFANAYNLPAPAARKLHAVPVPKNYAAPAAAPVTSYEEEPVEERVVYKAPVRNIERQPIRVAYNEENPVLTRGGYEEKPVLSRGGYEAKPVVEEETYAKSAQYSFASAVDDGIMDQSHIHQETRDGNKVTGSYAYSDGYFKHTVNYEADENGYRVVGETVDPISESGPQIDLVNGRAEVHTQIGGVQTQYSVSADELDAHRKRHSDVLLRKEAAAY